jgi:hypothetical protein
MKQRDDLGLLADMQEDANTKLSSARNVFIEKTSVMKKVCISCSPRAPWRILHENLSWCSQRNSFEFLNLTCSPQAPWVKFIPSGALRRLGKILMHVAPEHYGGLKSGRVL